MITRRKLLAAVAATSMTEFALVAAPKPGNAGVEKNECGNNGKGRDVCHDSCTGNKGKGVDNGGCKAHVNDSCNNDGCHGKGGSDVE